MNQSWGFLRVVSAIFLPLHQQFSQRPLPKSLVPGFWHLIVPKYKVSGLFENIKSKSSCLELQRCWIFIRLLAGVPGVLSSQKLPLTSTKNLSWFFPITIHKGSEILQALAKEHFELIPCKQKRAICIMLLLVLLAAKTNPVLEERYGKKNLVNLFSSSCGKIFFTLLTEVVILYMRLFAIHVWRTGF